jgi:hypothetical protein
VARAVVALATIAALAGCASPSGALFGQQQEASVRSASHETRATLEMTVEKPTTLPMSQTDVELDDYPGGTLHLVRYTARVIDGVYDPHDTFSFSSYRWQGDAADGGEVSAPIFARVPECVAFDETDAAALAAGDSIRACVLLASASSSLTRVTFDRPSISYKNRDLGHSWRTD